jgi:uncharacterized membrane protein
MTPGDVLFFAFVIGLLSGLRSLTPIAVVAWGAHWGWLRLPRSLVFIGSPTTAAIFTVLALLELVADKLPGTPNRTAPPGLMARILTGSFAGACLATAGGQSATYGAVAGGIGGVIGCFGGYQTRVRLVKALRTPDVIVALLEDLVTIGGSFWVVSRFMVFVIAGVVNTSLPR